MILPENRRDNARLPLKRHGDADKNTGIPHFDSKFKIEQHLKSSTVNHSLAAPVFFMDTLLADSSFGCRQRSVGTMILGVT